MKSIILALVLMFLCPGFAFAASAVEWDALKVAAEKGNAQAQYEVGADFKDNDEDGLDEAIVWFRKAALQGHLEAQYRLGDALVIKESGEAVKWLRRAAERGHVAAMSLLGWVYDRGIGVPVNPAQALFWYRKASEKGDGVSQYRLGKMYELGVGVKPNRAEAVKLYLQSVSRGYSPAGKALEKMGETYP